MGSGRSRPDQQEYTLLEQTRIRNAIGDRTRQSINEKPQFWMTVQVDATAMVEVRAALRTAGGEIIPSYNDFILKMVALALPENPRFNAWKAEDGLRLLTRINLGFAVATDQGVMLPTLMDADEKSLAQIAQETRELIDLARRGRLRATLQMGAGFTVSNIGPADVDAFSAIISPPQTGILAIAALAPRPAVVGDQVVSRKTINCTLTVDHSAADGADGAKFLGDLKRRLEDTELLAGLAGTAGGGPSP